MTYNLHGFFATAMVASWAARNCALGVRNFAPKEGIDEHGFVELSSGEIGSDSEYGAETSENAGKEAKAYAELRRRIFGSDPENLKQRLMDEPCGPGIKEKIMVANDYVKVNAINWDSTFKQIDTFLEEQGAMMQKAKQGIEKYEKELASLPNFDKHPQVSDDLIVQLISGACEETYGKYCRQGNDAVDCEGWKSCSHVMCGARMEKNQIESQEWAKEAFMKLAGKKLDSSVSVNQGKASELCYTTLRSGIEDHSLDIFCDDLCDGFAATAYQQLHSLNLRHIDRETYLKESLTKYKNVLKDAEGKLNGCQVMKKDLSRLGDVLKELKANHKDQRQKVKELLLALTKVKFKLAHQNSALAKKEKEEAAGLAKLDEATQEEKTLKGRLKEILDSRKQSELDFDNNNKTLSTIGSDIASITGALTHSTNFKMMLAVEVNTALDLHHQSIRDPLQTTLNCIDTNLFKDPPSLEAASIMKDKAEKISEFCEANRNQYFKDVSLSDDYRLVLPSGTQLQPVLESDLATPEVARGSLIEASTRSGAPNLKHIYKRVVGKHRCEPWEERIPQKGSANTDREACKKACSEYKNCTAITWIPSAMQKCYLFEKCDFVAVPRKPGCYLRLPTGCPLRGLQGPGWSRDLVGDKNGNNQDEASCRARKDSIDKWCEVSDTEMLFLSDEDAELADEHVVDTENEGDELRTVSTTTNVTDQKASTDTCPDFVFSGYCASNHILNCYDPDGGPPTGKLPQCGVNDAYNCPTGMKKCHKAVAQGDTDEDEDEDSDTDEDQEDDEDRDEDDEDGNSSMVDNLASGTDVSNNETDDLEENVRSAENLAGGPDAGVPDGSEDDPPLKKTTTDDKRDRDSNEEVGPIKWGPDPDKCITVFSGGVLKLLECDGTGAQNFNVPKVGQQGKIHNTSKCMIVVDQELKLDSCDKGGTEAWIIEKSVGKIRLVNPEGEDADGMCLDVDVEKATVVVNKCDYEGAKEQAWWPPYVENEETIEKGKEAEVLTSEDVSDIQEKSLGRGTWSLEAEGRRFKKESSTKKATGMADLCSPEVASKWEETTVELVKVVKDKQDEVKGVIEKFQGELQALHDEAAELPGSPSPSAFTEGKKKEEAICHDFPRDWKDPNGLGCDQYESKCQDKKAMTAGGLELEASFNPENRYSAIEACCACGGGYVTASREELVYLRSFIRKFKDTKFYNNYLKFWQVPTSDPAETGTEYFVKMMSQLEESAEHLRSKKYAFRKFQTSLEKRIDGLKKAISDVEVDLTKATLKKETSEKNLVKLRQLVEGLKKHVAEEEQRKNEVAAELTKAEQKLHQLEETIKKEHKENTGVSSMLNLQSSYHEAGEWHPSRYEHEQWWLNPSERKRFSAEAKPTDAS